MKFQRLTPMFWTAELGATIEFYTEVLGFVLEEYNENWGWCSMAKDDVAIMFARPNDHTPFDQPTATATFYIYIDEVDELWEHLQGKAELFYHIDNFGHGMREFAIKDNNGYILQFGRELKSGETITSSEENQPT